MEGKREKKVGEAAGGLNRCALPALVSIWTTGHVLYMCYI